MSNKTVTIELTEDELASIYWALADRSHALSVAKNDKNRHGSLVRIDERQFDRNSQALRIIEDAINQVNYA